jgi:predicted nucleotidyltransferase
MNLEETESTIRAELPNLPTEGVDELAEAVGNLVEGLRPEEIWVFGSHARGTAGEESDVDLMVIVPESDLPAHRRDQEALEAIARALLS